MSIETAIRELDEICKFLKGHTDVTQAQYNLSNELLRVDIESSSPLPGMKIWVNQIKPKLIELFDRTVVFKFKEVPTAESNTLDELTAIQRKLIGNTTYVFNSPDNKYRLLRREPERKVFEEDETYYKESVEISELEIKTANQLFQLAVDDHKAGRFIKNFIEININNARSVEIMSKYAFIFRQIPKQFTDRFILSLVRIPPKLGSAKINEAIKHFRQIISPIYASAELDYIKNNLNLIKELECDGFIITVGNPQRKDISKEIKNMKLGELNKQVFLIYYTRDCKGVPSFGKTVNSMHMTSKIGE